MPKRSRDVMGMSPIDRCRVPNGGALLKVTSSQDRVIVPAFAAAFRGFASRAPLRYSDVATGGIPSGLMDQLQQRWISPFPDSVQEFALQTALLYSGIEMGIGTPW